MPTQGLCQVRIRIQNRLLSVLSHRGKTKPSHSETVPRLFQRLSHSTVSRGTSLPMRHLCQAQQTIPLLEEVHCYTLRYITSGLLVQRLTHNCNCPALLHCYLTGSGFVLTFKRQFLCSRMRRSSFQLGHILLRLFGQQPSQAESPGDANHVNTRSRERWQDPGSGPQLGCGTRPAI